MMECRLSVVIWRIFSECCSCGVRMSDCVWCCLRFWLNDGLFMGCFGVVDGYVVRLWMG